MNNAIVEDINRQLLQFGLNTFGDAKFRVVFSTDQREMRNGEHKNFNDEGTYLNTYFGIREVPKYRWMIDKWILEKWAGQELTYHPDIVSARNGDYVCIYIFQDKDGNALPPIWEMARLIVGASLNPRTKIQALEDDFAFENKKEKQEEDEIFNRIKTNYENTATEVETMAISAFVEPSKNKIGVKDE